MIFTKTTARTDVRLPTKGSIEPNHDALLAKRDELGAEATSLEKERLQIIERIHNGAELQPAPDSELASHAQALLGRGAGEHHPGDRQRLTQIESRLRLVRHAQELLASDIHEAERLASKKLTDEAQPEFRRLIGAVCATLVGAHSANRDLHHFIHTMADRGADTSAFNQMTPD